MPLTGGQTSYLGLKKCKTTEPYDTDWGEDFNSNYDVIDGAISNISTALDGKADLSGATFTGEMAIERSNNPGSLRISGTGNNYNYAHLILESKEETPKSWNLILRKYSDYPYGLIFQQYDGSSYYDRFILTSNGNACFLTSKVGINTNNPNYPFDVRGSSNLQVSDNSATWPPTSVSDLIDVKNYTAVRLYNDGPTASLTSLHFVSRNTNDGNQYQAGVIALVRRGSGQADFSFVLREGASTVNEVLRIRSDNQIYAKSIVPFSSAAFNLGSSTLLWNNIYSRFITIGQNENDSSTNYVTIKAYANYINSGTYYNRGIYIIGYINNSGDQTANNSGHFRGCHLVSMVRENAGTLAEVSGLHIEEGAYGPGGEDVACTITDLYGIRIVGYTRPSTTIVNHYGIRIGGIVGTNAWGIYQSDTNIKNFFGSSIVIGNTAAIDSSASKVLAMGQGTAPASAPADAAQLWVEDINGAAGKAGLHMMAESGTNKLVVVGTIIKSSTGDPSQVHEGLMCINTADKNVKIYAGGGWRQIASWT